jgi:hypothetical protein
VTSETGEGIRANDDSTWRDKVIENFFYYYDLEDVYLERAAYQPKATSAGITATGFAGSAAATSSNEDSDTDADTGQGAVPDSVIANLERTGVYTTPTVRSRLTSESSNTAATKKGRKTSRNSSNKKGRTSCNAFPFTDGESFDHMATKYMNNRMRTEYSKAPHDEPKSRIVSAYEDAATQSKHFRTCVDNFGSRVLAAWSCKDSCPGFVKFLTPAERREFKEMQKEEDDDPEGNLKDPEETHEDHCEDTYGAAAC